MHNTRALLPGPTTQFNMIYNNASLFVVYRETITVLVGNALHYELDDARS